jgi:predicted site-specific integrase-resolvase
VAQAVVLFGVKDMSEQKKLEGKHYYSDKEFCEAMEIDRRTSKRWRDARIIGYVRSPTGMIRYLQRHVDAFEKRNEKKARAA